MKNLYLSIFIIAFSFVTQAQQSGTFTDPRDSKTYKSVKIGNQIWMAENLNYKTKDSWCYDNQISNCNKYGRLYTWEAAKKACPTGWHLPSKEEFDTLLNNAGGYSNAAYNSIKKGGNLGFSAQFGGWRYERGDFLYIDTDAYLWSSSPGINEYAWNLGIHSGIPNAELGNNDRSCGFSVRCLRNE